MQYIRVTDEQELLEALSQSGTVILCGGTDVLVKMRAGAVRPARLVDISRMPSLQGVRENGPWIEIGAATPLSEVMSSPPVTTEIPLLVTVLRMLGSVQIRHRATLGGNLVNASPAADSAVPLLLHDAELQIVGCQGDRWMRLEEFFVGPGSTQLAHGEFIRTVRVARGTDGAAFYHKIGRRNALTIAIASVGAVAQLDHGTVREVRLAVGSVAPTPLRLRSVEALLRGRRLTPGAVEAAQSLARQAISPISDVRAPAEYRMDAVGELIGRALTGWMR